MKKSSKSGGWEKMDWKGVASIGMDLSDRTAEFHALDGKANTIGTGKVTLVSGEVQRWAAQIPPTVIAIEAGTHSPWVSRVLSGCGHEVIVANPVKVRLISQNTKKRDKEDAELVARLALADRSLLFPIRHRGEQAQIDLQLIRTRAIAVELPDAGLTDDGLLMEVRRRPPPLSYSVASALERANSAEADTDCAGVGVDWRSRPRRLRSGWHRLGCSRPRLQPSCEQLRCSWLQLRCSPFQPRRSWSQLHRSWLQLRRSQRQLRCS